ncbi:hypothetical protein LU293_09620 [Moraxella nasovis]|uniref:hypothetical protein n=1 Tax=Moraxella nasovis TaxID=2904121 RepID=UPI001F614DBA|nr:hypothetical protein [Moraxella nasovis]UNU73305.1 hypothetical protein LU293_09620 [Moraxella nasovis]
MSMTTLNHIYSKDEVRNAIQIMIDYLTNEVLADESDKPAEPLKFKVPSASTSEVSNITGQSYSWHSLRHYCLENELEFHQVEVGRLTVNSYPAQAWLVVHGVNLDKVFSAN